MLILILQAECLFSLVTLSKTFQLYPLKTFCENHLSSKWIDRGGNTSPEPHSCSCLTVIQLQHSWLPGDCKGQQDPIPGSWEEMVCIYVKVHEDAKAKTVTFPSTPLILQQLGRSLACRSIRY